MACTADSVFAAFADKPSPVKELAFEAAKYLDNITRLDRCSDCVENTENKCDPVKTPEDITATDLVGLTCWGLPAHSNVPTKISIYSHFDPMEVNNIVVKDDDDTGVELTVAMVVYGFDFRKKKPEMLEYEMIYETGKLIVHRGMDNYFGWVDRAPKLVIELANKVRILDMGLDDVLSRIRVPCYNNNIQGLYVSELKEYGKHLRDHVNYPLIKRDKDDYNVEVSFCEVYFMGENLHKYDSVEEIIDAFAYYNPRNRRSQFLFNTPVSQVFNFRKYDMSRYWSLNL